MYLEFELLFYKKSSSIIIILANTCIIKYPRSGRAYATSNLSLYLDSDDIYMYSSVHQRKRQVSLCIQTWLKGSLSFIFMVHGYLGRKMKSLVMQVEYTVVRIITFFSVFGSYFS